MLLSGGHISRLKNETTLYPKTFFLEERHGKAVCAHATQIPDCCHNLWGRKSCRVSGDDILVVSYSAFPKGQSFDGGLRAGFRSLV